MVVVHPAGIKGALDPRLAEFFGDPSLRPPSGPPSPEHRVPTWGRVSKVAAAAVSGRAATQIVAKAVMTEAGVLSYVALGIVVVVAAEETVSETREIATAFGTVGTLTGGAGGKTEGR